VPGGKWAETAPFQRVLWSLTAQPGIRPRELPDFPHLCRVLPAFGLNSTHAPLWALSTCVHALKNARQHGRGRCGCRTSRESLLSLRDAERLVLAAGEMNFVSMGVAAVRHVHDGLELMWLRDAPFQSSPSRCAGGL
jgi:hypothetical protein